LVQKGGGREILDEAASGVIETTSTRAISKSGRGDQVVFCSVETIV